MTGATSAYRCRRERLQSRYASVREAGDGAESDANASVREAGDGAESDANASVREAGDGAEFSADACILRTVWAAGGRRKKI